ncbi:MAG: ATP-binding protein, partial [Bacteroidales bacterium]|nr:ATP-binding protein [Bacteroidales bacterium]
DRVINLCEMKFSVKPYHISDNYEKTLRDRMSIFQEKTKTDKSLVYTFVTTFGVANGMGRSIVNSEITMDDLFAK